MAQPRKYDNRLGLKGWWSGGRWGFERYAYTLHRLTGLGLVAYFVMHILVTSSRAFGQTSWAQWMDTVGGPLFRVGEFLVVLCFIYHAFNGIRLILVELGFAVGKAEEPIYPYRSSLNNQRPLLITMMVLAAIAVVVTGYDFWMLHH
jgi:succinate dehydrogenase / fumarate reductase cytochrome b subunit